MSEAFSLNFLASCVDNPSEETLEKLNYDYSTLYEQFDTNSDTVRFKPQSVVSRTAICIKPPEIYASQDPEPSVKLVSEEEYAKIFSNELAQEDLSEDYPQTPEDDVSLCSRPAMQFQCHTTSCDVSNVNDYIEQTCIDFIEKQQLVDSGSYKKSGPGRRRRNVEQTSSQLRHIVRSYLFEKFDKISKNTKVKGRMDACITFYFRVLKKLTYHLVEKAAAKNMYKRKNSSEYSVAFAESFIAFLSSINATYDQPLVAAFVEYIVIYFPYAKCSSLIDDLIKQRACDESFLYMQMLNLREREGTSKRNLTRWAASSNIFRKLLQLCLEVLETETFNSKQRFVIDHLIRVTQDVLNSDQ